MARKGLIKGFPKQSMIWKSPFLFFFWPRQIQIPEVRPLMYQSPFPWFMLQMVWLHLQPWNSLPLLFDDIEAYSGTSIQVNYSAFINGVASNSDLVPPIPPKVGYTIWYRINIDFFLSDTGLNSTQLTCVYLVYPRILNLYIYLNQLDLVPY